MTQRFAAIGLDHRHIYDLTAGLVDAGLECAGYWPETSDPRVLDGFRKRFPDVPEARDRFELMENPDISIAVIAAIPRDRAEFAIDAMSRGMDVMVDKPGATTFAQLAAIERTVAETRRIFSVCFGERFLTPSTDIALRMARDGAIGRVVQTVGLGPHRLNRAIRPAWFWDRDAYGGILVDIASHQIDQFIVFTGTERPEILHSAVGCFGDIPGFDDFGEISLRGERASGYIRVDWFTADGLPTWGDGRLTILGTEGTIELRKHVDIAGRSGADHLFLVDRHGTRHIDGSGEKLSYFHAFAHDVAHRGETAMPLSHVFTVCRLALEAEARAVRLA